MLDYRPPENCDPVHAPVRAEDGAQLALVRDRAQRLWLHVTGRADEFHGNLLPRDGGGKLCPLTSDNVAPLARKLPWLRPTRLPDDRPSFGFGDRMGLASPGHLRSVRGRRVFPVLAQQSVRENTRTGRSFADVLADATFAAFREGHSIGFGADADHLKTVSDAEEACHLGYTFFTCDPGDRVVSLDGTDDAQLPERFASLPDRSDLEKRYLDRSYRFGDSTVVRFTAAGLQRAAVKYGAAISHAVRMYRAIRALLGDAFDYEVSIDETADPTSPLEHLFMASELRHREVNFVSLAPRFVGAMEKGVEWRGDMRRFREDLALHAAIADSIGGYRLSLHSGSDKYSLYPELSRAMHGKVHIKTAGTSYLVALEVVARHLPSLFRRIMAHSLEAFAEDQATYHISADPQRIPSVDGIADEGLPGLVATHDSRQILHVAYGSVLRSALGDELRSALTEHEEEHFEALDRHMQRHLRALEVMPDDDT